MEPIQSAKPDWLQGFQAKLEATAEAHTREHAERMAALPLGTCEKCYGEGVLNGDPKIPCPDCSPKPEPVICAKGTPAEFQTATLENYRRTPGNAVALEKAWQLLTEFERDLYICGGVGAGKTRLACSIANDWRTDGGGAMFARVPMLLHRLQPGRDDDAVSELERQLFTYRLLVLDDLGAERDQATDYTRRTLLMIYEERCDRGLRTIWTSNKTLQQLGDMQDDDRLASRIAGRADVVLLNVSDQRLAGRKR